MGEYHTTQHNSHTDTPTSRCAHTVFKSVDNYDANDPARNDVGAPRGAAERGAIEINGQTPGPVVNQKPREKKNAIFSLTRLPNFQIRLKLGQTLVANVFNHIHGLGISIHWHGVSFVELDGILQDGADRITQSAIPGGGRHTYRFTPSHSGTFFYHAHNVGYFDGLYGALIVEGPEDPAHDVEAVALISEWGVAVETDLDAAFESNKLKDGVVLTALENSRSVLVNGKVSDNVAVRTGQKVLLRVINAAFVSNIGIAVAGNHPLQIIQADGYHVERATFSGVFFGAFGPGQRYTFLLDANDAGGSFEIKFTSFLNSIDVGGAIGPAPASLFLVYPTATPSTTLPYNAFGTNPPDPLPLPIPNSGVLLSERALFGDTTSPQYGKVPKTADLIVTFETGLNFANGAWHLAANTPFDLAPGAPFIAGNRKGAVSFNIPLGAVVDVITIAAVIAHPFHTHLFSGFQIAHGVGAFPGYDAAIATANLVNPVRRDTYITNVEDVPNGVGWSITRIIADRKGPAFCHCHIM
jgi:FtsP/CotA-like multicopper oxidase with cupredoxin domain